MPSKLLLINVTDVCHTSPSLKKYVLIHQVHSENDRLWQTTSIEDRQWKGGVTMIPKNN